MLGFYLLLKRNIMEKTLSEVSLFLYNTDMEEINKGFARALMADEVALFRIINGRLMSCHIDREIDGLSFRNCLKNCVTLEEEPRKQRIFFDMDGTVAEWKKDAVMEEVFEPGYFRDRPVMPNVQEAIRILSSSPYYDCKILSAYNIRYPHTVLDKKLWIQKHLPFLKEDSLLFVPVGEAKSDYVPFPKGNDILVDDYNPNLLSWHGLPIKMLNDINSLWKGHVVSHSMEPKALADAIASLGKIPEKRFVERYGYAL